jgi:hypothetical protein
MLLNLVVCDSNFIARTQKSYLWLCGVYVSKSDVGPSQTNVTYSAVIMLQNQVMSCLCHSVTWQLCQEQFTASY